MKTPQERAKEYADSLLDREDDLFEWNCRYNGYEAGYEACNAEWEEKTRWIPVTERLPEFNHTILFRTIDKESHCGQYRGYMRGTVHIFQTMDYIGYKFDDVTHWKEII